MSSEPRHGPVTMHRAIERAMLKRIASRPADAPAVRPLADDAAESPATGDGPVEGRDVASSTRGGTTGQPRRARRERQR